jgi:hypothetical protein
MIHDVTYVRTAVLAFAAMMMLLLSDSAPLRERAVADDGQCTTAVVAASASASGRPLLWKNRDVSITNQEVVFFDDRPYCFITITNAGDTSEAFAGVNDVGFAIEDANNWNTPDTVAGPDDDGLIIRLALRTCRAVADFQSILDSTRIVGHRTPAIFGVIDAAGGASMFETFGHTYTRYDASNPLHAPHGVLVRSNFSYAGSSSGRIGVYRHDRAKALMEGAALGDTLTPFFICRHVARDLRRSSSFDPYPLPYEGQQGNLPWGWINTEGAICRRMSVSGLVVEGVALLEDPLLATMWTFAAPVQFSAAFPFWVASHTTPPEVNGDSIAPLCTEGQRIKYLAQHAPDFRDTLDTYFLEDGHGGGIHATTFPLEDFIFARADSAIAQWRATGQPDSASMTMLTAQFARMVYDTLRMWPRPGDLWCPPKSVNTLTLYRVPGQGIRLRWLPVTQDTLGLSIVPAGYSIWHMRNWPSTYDSVGFTTSTNYMLTNPADSVGIYVVKAVR